MSGRFDPLGNETAVSARREDLVGGYLENEREAWSSRAVVEAIQMIPKIREPARTRLQSADPESAVSRVRGSDDEGLLSLHWAAPAAAVVVVTTMLVEVLLQRPIDLLLWLLHQRQSDAARDWKIRGTIVVAVSDATKNVMMMMMMVAVAVVALLWPFPPLWKE